MAIVLRKPKAKRVESPAPSPSGKIKPVAINCTPELGFKEAMKEKLLTLKRTAAMLNMSTKYLRNEWDKGRIRAVIKGTEKRKILLFPQESIDSYIQRMKTWGNQCQSISAKVKAPIHTTSNTKANGFLAIPKPPTKKKLS